MLPAIFFVDETDSRLSLSLFSSLPEGVHLELFRPRLVEFQDLMDCHELIPWVEKL